MGRLVAAGTLRPEQAAAVRRELSAGAVPAQPSSPWSARLAEVAGYLGAALTAAASLVFLGESWDDLSTGSRVTLLAAAAAVAYVAALIVLGRALGKQSVLRTPTRSARRRLASTLHTIGSAAAGFAAGVAAEAGDIEPVLTIASLVALLLLGGGYLIVRSAVTEVGLAVAVALLVSGFFDALDTDSVLPVAVALVAVGAAWAALTRAGAWLGDVLGYALAVTFALIGAQLPVLEGDLPEWGYALTVAVAAACFAGYVRVPRWPLVAGGVLAVTLVVPEMAFHWTDGALGGAGALLLTGASLLAASAAGFALHRRRAAAGG